MSDSDGVYRTGGVMDDDHYDVAVLGTGPAGLQAAIHAGRSKVSVIVLGKIHQSGLFNAHVENYCCLGSIGGEEMLTAGIAQAKAAGAEFSNEDVIHTNAVEEGFVIESESGRQIHAKAMIMAMGIKRKRLGVTGEKKLLGKGVSYCVDCDANFYKNEKVAIVGNESSAVSGALTMLFYASEVHLVTEKLNVNEQLADHIQSSDVQIHLGRSVKQIEGEDAVTGVVMDNGDRLDVSGVFVELGAKGAVELAATMGVALDTRKFKYIETDKSQKTNIDGIYAAGDICGPPWQVAKAVGEGCVAGISASKYVKSKR
jgi:thioredoxin reductase (NADPH)